MSSTVDAKKLQADESTNKKIDNRDYIEWWWKKKLETALGTKNKVKSIILYCRKEVMDVFREKDRDFDGRMSYEEFVGHETRFELAFMALDTNGDGFVSRSEFKKICPNMTKEQMDAAFAKFDKDKTGRINYTEFCSMLNKNQQQASASKWKVIFL